MRWLVRVYETIWRKPTITKELARLQRDLAVIDLRSATIPQSSDIRFLIVLKLQNIRVRMDANRNHERPHIHVDYGKEYHVASYAIDTGERIAGDLKSNYDRKVQEFISACRPRLIRMWKLMQAGESTSPILAELRGS
jgi:hypothetical protein